MINKCITNIYIYLYKVIFVYIRRYIIYIRLYNPIIFINHCKKNIYFKDSFRFINRRISISYYKNYLMAVINIYMNYLFS